MRWEDEDKCDGGEIDVLPPKSIICEDVLSLCVGQHVEASYEKDKYPVIVVDKGNNAIHSFPCSVLCDGAHSVCLLLVL